MTGPQGPWVYFLEEDQSKVIQAIIELNPPGQALWGMNKSRWKKGCWYVHGEDEIPMEEIVRKALRGKAGDAIEVLPLKEGLELENAAAPRRYRDRRAKETKP